MNITILIVSIVLFCVYPVNGERIALITGTNRLVFSALCIVICLCFYNFKFRLPAFIHKPLSTLGEMSYSVYLLHPIFWALFIWVFKKTAIEVSPLLNLLICAVCTLTGSLLVYNIFEKYFIKLGKRLIATRFLNFR